MDDKHICDKEVVLRRALDVADAVEWRGDTTVNFMTALRSARVLAEEVRRLRAIADAVESLHYGTDLFTSCAAVEADRLIELIEKKVSDEI